MPGVAVEQLGGGGGLHVDRRERVRHDVVEITGDAHPLLLDQLERLIAAVERDRKKKPKTYRSAANAKVLAALRG